MSLISRSKILKTAIAVEIFSSWYCPKIFGFGNFKSPNLSELALED